MCDLAGNVGNLKKLFDEYAGREGNPDTLTKREMKQMFEEKLKPMLKGAKCPDKVDQVFQCMDKNADGEVDFGEFMQAAVMMLSATNGWKVKCSKS